MNPPVTHLHPPRYPLLLPTGSGQPTLFRRGASPAFSRQKHPLPSTDWLTGPDAAPAFWLLLLPRLVGLIDSACLCPRPSVRLIRAAFPFVSGQSNRIRLRICSRPPTTQLRTRKRRVETSQENKRNQPQLHRMCVSSAECFGAAAAAAARGGSGGISAAQAAARQRWSTRERTNCSKPRTSPRVLFRFCFRSVHRRRLAEKGGRRAAR